MDSLIKAYYRAFQAVFNVGAHFLYWRKPIVKAGAGSIRGIPELLKQSSSKRPLIITGPHIRVSLVPALLEIFNQTGIPYEIFSEVEGNPSIKTCEKIRDAYISKNCDSIIAIGGGSPMDAAKAAAARIVRPKRSIKQLSGLLKVRKKIPTFIAVPTTAGTGSETTIAAVITDQDTHHKAGIMDLCLVPKYAILDSELTVALPPQTTAATGMDALTHAIEAYICWTYNTKESLRDAEEAVVAIFKYLEKAYSDGSDITARGEMLIASFKAGFAFTRAGVGNVHAIAHTLGGIYNTPHGLANAVILPIVLEDYGKAVYPKLARLAELSDLPGNSAKEKSERFIAEIRAMNSRMNIPSGFDFIKDADIDQMITWALAEANPLYPVPVIYNREHCRNIIEKIRQHSGAAYEI